MQYGRVATLVLIVGLPGAGKTTQAKELAAQHHAIRLTPDEWMIPLFGLCWRQPVARGRRDVLEGRLISIALQALRLEASVVLDFGFCALRPSAITLATSSGAVAGTGRLVTAGGLADSAGFQAIHSQRFAVAKAPDKML
jgi:predicted kinase